MRILRLLPNALTLARLLALPALLVVLLTADGRTSALGAGLFGAIAFTDFLDGRLARALHAESRFGQIADPLADRLLVAVGLVGLIALDRFHWAGPATILARDALSMLAFAWYARRGVVLRVDFAGKTSSTICMFATGFAMLLRETWVDVLFWVALAASVATLLNYARTLPRPGRAAASADAASTRS